MKEVQELSVVYQNTTKRMKEKGFKFLSDLEVRSYLIERMEFWIDKVGNGYVLEVSKMGHITIYKETKI